jgi:hypothetical protein
MRTVPLLGLLACEPPTPTPVPVPSPPPDPVEAVCARWTAERDVPTEGTWTGDVATCDPGTLSQDARDATLQHVNLHRFLAGLEPLEEATERHDALQQCALMMTANGMLVHYPPDTWNCFTAAGAGAAAGANLSPEPSVSSVLLYMVDPGNEDTLGHRRWILSNWNDGIAVGGTGSYSCMGVGGGRADATGPAWTAWPPPGVVPIDALSIPGYTDVDTVGWHIQSDTVDLRGTTVTVTLDGASLPVRTSILPADYGSAFALRIAPDGWSVAAGSTYSVAVAGTDIAYDVQIVDCDAG